MLARGAAQVAFAFTAERNRDGLQCTQTGTAMLSSDKHFRWVQTGILVPLCQHPRENSGWHVNVQPINYSDTVGHQSHALPYPYFRVLPQPGAGAAPARPGPTGQDQ